MLTESLSDGRCQSYTAYSQFGFFIHMTKINVVTLVTAMEGWPILHSYIFICFLPPIGRPFQKASLHWCGLHAASISLLPDLIFVPN